jgi:Phosphatidyl serine synthase
MLPLNLHLLQSLLWMEPDHPIVIARLAGIFLCGLPAVRELYQYVNDRRYVFYQPLPSLVHYLKHVCITL